jgi:hypothetical protein
LTIAQTAGTHGDVMRQRHPWKEPEGTAPACSRTMPSEALLLVVVVVAAVSVAVAEAGKARTTSRRRGHDTDRTIRGGGGDASGKKGTGVRQRVVAALHGRRGGRGAAPGHPDPSPPESQPDTGKFNLILPGSPPPNIPPVLPTFEAFSVGRPPTADCRPQTFGLRRPASTAGLDCRRHWTADLGLPTSDSLGPLH